MSENTKIESDQEEPKRFDPLENMVIPKYQSMRKYDESWMPERAFELLCKGGSLARVAAELGICGDTLRVWRKDADKEQLSASIKAGRQVGQAYWEEMAKESMWDTSINLGVNFIMVMRNQYGMLTRDPDKAEEKSKELMGEMKAIRSGGRVSKEQWTKTMIKRSG